MEALKVGCAATVCGSSQGVPNRCLTAIAPYFLVVKWEIDCAVVAVLERGSWGRR